MNNNTTTLTSTASTSFDYDDIFQDTYKSVYSKIFIILSFFELLNIIFFAVQFLNKKSIFYTPYFVIFTTSLVVNFLCNIPSMEIVDFYNEGPIFYSIVRTTTIYSWFFVTTIHVTLIANRCTALWFPFRLTQFWNFRNSFIIILINLLIPYIFGGFYLFKIYSTGIAPTEFEIVNKIELFFITPTCLLSIGIVIFFHKQKITKMPKQIAKIEKRLIYQSIIVLICVLIDLSMYRIVDDMIFKPLQISGDYQDILFMVADIFYVAQQILDVIFLFIVSESFRTAILNFYSFGSYAPKKRNSIHVGNALSMRNPVIFVHRETTF